MKTLIAAVIIAVPIFCAAAEDDRKAVIYDDGWNRRGYIEKGEIYDDQYRRRGHIRDGKIYDENWNRKGSVDLNDKTTTKKGGTK